MSETMIIRVMSNAGRSRLEMTKTTTVAELKKEISTRIGVDIKNLNIFTD